MMILRIVGILFIVLAGFTFYRDIGQGCEFTSITLGQLWYDVSPSTLLMTQTIIERYIWPPLWNEGLSILLFLPAWTVFFGVTGMILFVLGLFVRRRASK